MAQALNPPWDLHSNTATKSLVLRDMKATPSPRLGSLFQPKPKRHLQIREISNVSDVSDVSLKGSLYLQLAAAALSGITILDSYIQTQEMMLTTWTYQLGSSTSCVLTEFVTSSRFKNIPRILRKHWIIPMAKASYLSHLTGSQAHELFNQRYFSFSIYFVVPFRCSTIFFTNLSARILLPPLVFLCSLSLPC